jgi:D-alanyl-lipoteichoic acid acyltransferase DltB (MBOAT superfamily)
VLFNSYSFCFIYLPAAFAAFYLIGARSREAAAWGLAGASLIFYGWWDWRFVPFLAGSVLFNFLLARELGRRRSKALLGVGVAGNLGLLVYFKYMRFFVSTIDSLSGMSLGWPEVILPLGISFFTFTQIMFLVDAHRGLAREYRFTHYLLFVTFFPHLIAGPLYQHRQIVPQFEREATYRLNWDHVATGLTIFVIGLAKKVLVADSLAPFADGAFDAARDGKTVMLFEAWIGALAYTLQLYFDFSGYSDMAIGLARLFNIKLPVNFDSPLKATSVIDFWRRWHMTLSAFFRHYVYAPLGGAGRRYRNVFVTMLLCGLWHGANWTFVLWGALQGSFIMVNHAWRRVAGPRALPAGFAWGLTFFCWMMSLVLFRADSVASAVAMYQSMLGLSGVSFPSRFESFEALKHAFEALFGAVQFTGVAPNMGGFGLRRLTILSVAACIALFARNTRQLMARSEAVWPRPWRPSFAWSAAVAVLLCASVLSLTRPSVFLYYQF